MVFVQVGGVCGLCGFSVRLFRAESAQEHREAAQWPVTCGYMAVRVLVAKSRTDGKAAQAGEVRRRVQEGQKYVYMFDH